MSEIKLKKSTFSHIEAELYEFHETAREIVRIKNEIISGKSSDDENVGGGRSSYISNPTQNTAIALVTHKQLEEMCRIHDAILTVYNQLPPEKQELVQVRYWNKANLLTWEGVSLKINISRRQAIRWRNEIVTAIAIKLGWR